MVKKLYEHVSNSYKVRPFLDKLRNREITNMDEQIKLVNTHRFSFYISSVFMVDYEYYLPMHCPVFKEMYKNYGYEPFFFMYQRAVNIQHHCKTFTDNEYPLMGQKDKNEPSVYKNSLQTDESNRLYIALLDEIIEKTNDSTAILMKALLYYDTEKPVETIGKLTALTLHENKFVSANAAFCAATAYYKANDGKNASKYMQMAVDNGFTDVNYQNNPIKFTFTKLWYDSEETNMELLTRKCEYASVERPIYSVLNNIFKLYRKIIGEEG